MKNFYKMASAVVLLSATLAGCRPETVNPMDADQKAPTLGAAENEIVLPVLDPVCGDAKIYQLIGLDGSTTVNRCFASSSTGYHQVACGPEMPAWGTVTIMNGLTDVIANIELASGWAGQAEWVRTADNSTFVTGTDGFPVVDNGWTQRVINPIVGKWQVARTLNTTGDVFAFGIKISVVKVDLLGDVIPGSETTLWLMDPQVETTVGSPFIVDWVRQFCPIDNPQPIQECRVVDVGAPALNGCTNLAPSVTTSNGPLTYAWSTGATSPSIVVCPTATTAYGVTISDATGPVAIYAYDVNVRNVSCNQGGPGQTRVSVCHIPPGNPNAPQDICMQWTSVRNHIPEYRTNPSPQDHNTGCRLGTCGSNPCEN